MLLGVLLAILVLYGLLLFWVLNERLKEIHSLVRSLSRKVDRLEERIWGSLDRREGKETKEGTLSVAEERFSVYSLEEEVPEKKGEGE